MIYSKDEFYGFLDDKRILDRKYLNIEAQSKLGKSLFTIRGDNLYVFKLTYQDQNNTKNEKKFNTAKIDVDRIYKAGMASSIINYRISLTTNKTNIQKGESMSILVVDEFISWFNRIINNRILVPDTNALMNRSLSSLCFVLGKEYLQNLMVRIPRLSVLEMERIANQDRHDQEKYNEQKRKVMSAAAELVLLKQNGGLFLPELDNETFEAFSRIAGEHFTDAWIRREIRQEINRQTYGVDEDRVKKVTLVTADLINALSANAEGMDVLYFSRAGSDNILPRSHNLDQIIQFIILISILFEEMKILINNENFLIKGIWEGKTTSEWITDSVMIERQ